jgi:hypothetical protein
VILGKYTVDTCQDGSQGRVALTSASKQTNVAEVPVVLGPLCFRITLKW